MTPARILVVEDDPHVGHNLFVKLDNALKYHRPEAAPSIEIGWQHIAGELQMFVRDNGRGIKSEYRQCVFGLFQRADTSIEGTGVGLAIAQRIIEVHGGSMWVDSQWGQGSCFWISLPDSAILNRESDRSDAQDDFTRFSFHLLRQADPHSVGGGQ